MGESDGHSHRPSHVEPVGPGWGCEWAPGAGAAGLPGHLLGQSLARQHMVAVMGAPGAQDSHDTGSLPQQGWRLRGHAALDAKLRVRTQAELLGGGAQL